MLLLMILIDVVLLVNHILPGYSGVVQIRRRTKYFVANFCPLVHLIDKLRRLRRHVLSFLGIHGLVVLAYRFLLFPGFLL